MERSATPAIMSSLLRLLFSLFFLMLLVAAGLLANNQYQQYSQMQAVYPAGSMAGDIPIGGLNAQAAADRIRAAYEVPVELRYGSERIHLDPKTIQFEIELLDSAGPAAPGAPASGWPAFWAYLQGQTPAPVQIAYQASYSEPLLRAFLEDISQRYDQPATAAVPIAGTVYFEPGQPGTGLDLEASLPLLDQALKSLTDRQVDLPLIQTGSLQPSYQNLEIMLRQVIGVAGFDGLASVYLLDLKENNQLHFAFQPGQEFSVEPVDIAFTASSLIKVPVMVSAYRRISENPDAETQKLLGDMIDESGNEAADWLMDRVMEPGHGPLLVSEDMKTLGLENTFLAGFFKLGSPLLAGFATPANTRTDLNTDPDPYSQTTASDMGTLLKEIYQCAQTGTGALTTTFPGEITQTKCQAMNDYLLHNKMAVLLSAGVPDGTPIAHKNGWASTNGVINIVSDAGIIYTPGRDYVLVVFLYHPVQVLWDPASLLIAQISQAVYNFFNLP